MKIKQLIGAFGAVAIALAMTACSPSVKEKKAEFDQTTLQGLLAQGFVLEKKEEGDAKSRYLLKLDKSEPVVNFLLRSATGSSDPLLRSELAELSRGMRLELAVDWPGYAEGKPGSVTATLLPADGNGTGELVRLLRERKVAADLDFDKTGHFQGLRVHPIDEPLQKGKKKGRLVVTGTTLKVLRSGKTPFDHAYELRSGALKLSLSEGKEERLELGYKKLECSVDTTDAYFGKRDCRVAELGMEMNQTLGGKPNRIRMLLEKADGNSRVLQQGQSVASDVQAQIARILVKEESAGEQKVDVTLKNVQIEGKASDLAADVYRKLVDLLANPPADEKRASREAMMILGDFFRRIVLGYGVTIDAIDAKVIEGGGAEETALGLRGLQWGIDWALGADFNLSKNFRLSQLTINHRQKGTTDLDGTLQGLSVAIRLEKLYNFMPQLMKMASDQLAKAQPKMDAATQKALMELGKKVTNQGAVIALEPLSLESLKVVADGEKLDFHPASLKLRVELLPNQLDPQNPMAPMLALAYLKADGQLTLSKKDLEQILPLLDPMTAAMAKRFVKYQGDRAIYELRFEQGNLLINGMPLQ